MVIATYVALGIQAISNIKLLLSQIKLALLIGLSPTDWAAASILPRVH